MAHPLSVQSVFHPVYADVPVPSILRTNPDYEFLKNNPRLRNGTGTTMQPKIFILDPFERTDSVRHATANNLLRHYVGNFGKCLTRVESADNSWRLLTEVDIASAFAAKFAPLPRSASSEPLPPLRFGSSSEEALLGSMVPVLQMLPCSMVMMAQELSIQTTCNTTGIKHPNSAGASKKRTAPVVVPPPETDCQKRTAPETDCLQKNPVVVPPPTAVHDSRPALLSARTRSG